MKPLVLISILILGVSSVFGQSYTMPPEHAPHEGTWLTWPHQYEYGLAYRNGLDATWVAMTQAMIDGENVHIIAYDETEKNRIIDLLNDASVSMGNIDFFIAPTNDVWIRDNGPIFVRDESNALFLADWGFNGWGGDYNFDLDDPIPIFMADWIGMPILDLNSLMTTEGGALELDGSGVLMATRSSIISQSPANSVRNPGMTQEEAEAILGPYLGISKFIWLDGGFYPGEVTDMHIDGFVKFLNDSVMVTMSDNDLDYWGVVPNDLDVLANASNAEGVPYEKVFLPLTQNNVYNTNGQNLFFKGSYVNYYVANEAVLVPNYNDPNDAVANAIVQSLYPDRVAVGIDVRNLYQWGGMVHCVTQQQPMAIPLHQDEIIGTPLHSIKAWPSPATDRVTLEFRSATSCNVGLMIYNYTGQIVYSRDQLGGSTSVRRLTIDIGNWAEGVYQCVLLDGHSVVSNVVLVKRN